MSRKKLEAFLAKHGIASRVLTFESHTLTVDDAERELGVSRENIIKSMLFIDETGHPILAIVTGDKKVSKERLAQTCKVKRVRIARPYEVKTLTGYEAGAVPPIGHTRPIRTVIDNKVLSLKRVFGGGGAINALLEIDPADIKRVGKGAVGDISER